MRTLVDATVAQAIVQWEGSAKLVAYEKLDAFKVSVSLRFLARSGGS
mgnify:FL=1